jgi:hypothetical protein
VKLAVFYLCPTIFKQDPGQVSRPLAARLKPGSKIEIFSKIERQNANNRLIIKFPIYVAQFCPLHNATNRHSEPGL